MLMFNPAHPGEVLREYMGNLEVGVFAVRIGVARTTLSRILNGHASITAAVALSLAEQLGTRAELWMGMQVQYDLWQAMQARKARLKENRPAKKVRSAAPATSQPTRRNRRPSPPSRASASTR